MTRHTLNLILTLAVCALAGSALAGDEPAEARLDLNTATMEQLMELPRVGPLVAARIITYREQNGGFRLAEELLDVRGIGPSTYESIRTLVMIAPPDEPPESVSTESAPVPSGQR